MSLLYFIAVLTARFDVICALNKLQSILGYQDTRPVLNIKGNEKVLLTCQITSTCMQQHKMLFEIRGSLRPHYSLYKSCPCIMNSFGWLPSLCKFSQSSKSNKCRLSVRGWEKYYNDHDNVIQCCHLHINPYVHA